MNSDVSTIIETGKERITPETVDRKITGKEVLKNTNATTDTQSQPMIPLMSADFLKITSIHTITKIGNSVKISDPTILPSSTKLN